MPRSNRPRGARHDDENDDLDLDRVRAGWRRTEVRRGISWNVQPISAVQAVKEYRCPGCGNAVDEGVAHLVVWRADGVLGEANDLADRRHWHTHCWRLA
jgi:hypothetical protein